MRRWAMRKTSLMAVAALAALVAIVVALSQLDDGSSGGGSTAPAGLAAGVPEGEALFERAADADAAEIGPAPAVTDGALSQSLYTADDESALPLPQVASRKIIRTATHDHGAAAAAGAAGGGRPQPGWAKEAWDNAWEASQEVLTALGRASIVLGVVLAWLAVPALVIVIGWRLLGPRGQRRGEA